MPTKVKVTHPDRVMFPADGIPKGELVDYYTQIADVMVPQLKDRPLPAVRLAADARPHRWPDFAVVLPVSTGVTSASPG